MTWPAGWAALLLAGAFEVGFASMLKLSDGFTRLVPSVLFALFAFLSFWLLTRAIETIPLGTAYAVWTGIGAVGTVAVGILFFQDPATFWRMAFVAGLIVCLVGLKVVSPA
ncbi:quaternary ammonium compound-resistance protein SugE [Hasllibacter halocynthiae]|uniref:Guanidinium exporter n=1 Tax=Hasllibacter halocynthiae TaxID=595589 RepID=A0A2T0X2I2_9RHOB|nr:multidrug efflux SMR transporter [Hasllibacter halocynthiae]PRY93159.1 quaternary ammonium compound-resistance protein SugE [Hasllibacter halocynthiae]